MKILISANCQTYGIASSLAAMCDIPPPICIQNIGADPLVLGSQLEKELKQADVFVYSNNNVVASELLAHHSFGIPAVKVPIVTFHAFHPDICYARKKLTHEFTRGHYNSAIAL